MTKHNLFESKPPSLRLPLGIAALIVMMLSIFTVWSLGQEQELVRILVENETKAYLETLKEALLDEIKHTEKSLQEDPYQELYHTSLVGIYRSGHQDVDWWPVKNDEPDIIRAPRWYIYKQVLQPEEQHAECFKILRKIQSTSHNEVKNALRKTLFEQCANPIVSLGHVISYEELVRYVEQGGKAESWWVDVWCDQIELYSPSNQQRDYLIHRLQKLKKQYPQQSKAIQFAIEKLQQVIQPGSQKLQAFMYTVLTQKLWVHEKFPKLFGWPPTHMLVTGKSNDGSQWIAAIDIKMLVHHTIAMKNLPIAGEIEYETVQDKQGWFSQTLYENRDFKVSVGSSQSRTRDVTIRYRFIVAGLFTVAILLIGFLVWFDYQRLRNMIRIDALRTQFIGRISHQFRTPLTTIRMYAESVLEKRIPEHKHDKYIQTIVTEAEELSVITDRLLNVSRIQQGHYVFNFQSCNVKEVVDVCVERIRTQLRHPVEKIEVTVTEHIPCFLCDKDSLAEAVYNLLENAAKYSQGGIINVMLFVKKKHLHLIIEDNGPGIPPKERKKIFKSYYRINDALTNQVTGTGLGLSVVENIVKAHHGSIEVGESSLGGAKFIVLLPIQECE